MKFRDRIGLSKHQQEQLARAMQLTLFGLLFVGLERRAPNVILNAGIGLAITFLPGIMERDYDIPMDPALTLWISAAAFMHAIGIIGIPGMGRGLYGSIPNYDHITHGLSASVVAATGYASVRAFDEHSEGTNLPPKFMFVFILIFVVSFGVLWEILEFSIDYVGQNTDMKLAGFTQHSLEDTMKDLIYNTAGGVVVAIWGTVYLADVVEALQERLASREREG